MPPLAHNLMGTTSVNVADQSTTAVLFEDEVHVHVRMFDREEVFIPLSITLSTTSRASGSGMRSMHVKVTDPRDPFFLYSVHITEDDYGRFKDKHELLVDFNGFPRHLTTMISAVSERGAAHPMTNNGTGGGVDSSLHSVALSSSQLPHEIYFVASGPDGAQGVLRIMERTDFRSLEHVSLIMQKQNDVGQKHHLAERLKFFEANFFQSENARLEEAQRFARIHDELRSEIERLQSDRDTLRQKLNVDLKEADASRMSDLSALKDQHAHELRQLHADRERERRSLIERYEGQVQQLAAEVRARDDQLRSAHGQISRLEASEQSLRTLSGQQSEEINHRNQEIARLSRDNQELHAFRIEATKYRTDTELERAAVGERLKHYVSSMAARDDELKTLRAQNDRQAEYARLLAADMEGIKQKNDALEGSLAKSHHVIASQLQAMKAAKEKSSALASQVQSLEAVVAEKSVTLERVRNESVAAKDRCDYLQTQIAALKEQLNKSEEQCAKLSAQLKQNEDALTHMYQTNAFGSSFRSRAIAPVVHSAVAHQQHLSYPPSGATQSHSGGLPAATLPLSMPAGMFREFARGEANALPTPAASQPPFASKPVGTAETTANGVQHQQPQALSPAEFVAASRARISGGAGIYAAASPSAGSNSGAAYFASGSTPAGPSLPRAGGVALPFATSNQSSYFPSA